VKDSRVALKRVTRFFLFEDKPWYEWPDVSNFIELTEAEYNDCKQVLLDHVTCVAGTPGCYN